LCQIVGGKIKFSSTIEGINDTLKGVLEYPNYGDLRHIRPFIRASEIGTLHYPKSKESPSEWSRNFWQYCFDQTGCIPEEVVSERIKNRQKRYPKKWKMPENTILKKPWKSGINLLTIFLLLLKHQL